jgi:hypothetical protein
MANHFGMTIPDPVGDPIYDRCGVSVKKTNQGWFIVSKDSVIIHYRQDKTDALRLACDMSFEEWAKEYESV